MVPFSLGRHKAHHLQVRDCQEPVGNTYRIHWVQPNFKTAETPAYGKVLHTQKSKQTEGMRETAWIKQRYRENTLDRGRGIKSTVQQAQESVVTPVDRQRELTKDANQEPQRELQSERCSYPQKEEEAFSTNGVYRLGSSESVTSDNEHWNHERTEEHPAPSI